MWTNLSDIEALISQLRSRDDIERENSAYLIGELGAEAFMLTSNTLKSKKDIEKINVLTKSEVLDKGVDALIIATKDSNAWVRGNAAEALGKCHAQKAVDTLIRCLDDDEQVVRSSAVESLGIIGDYAATESLSNLLCAAEWSIRMQAVRALGQLGNPAAQEALTNALRDERADVSIAAREALDQSIDESTMEKSSLRVK